MTVGVRASGEDWKQARAEADAAEGKASGWLSVLSSVLGGGGGGRGAVSAEEHERFRMANRARQLEIVDAALSLLDMLDRWQERHHFNHTHKRERKHSQSGHLDFPYTLTAAVLVDVLDLLGHEALQLLGLTGKAAARLFRAVFFARTQTDARSLAAGAKQQFERPALASALGASAAPDAAPADQTSPAEHMNLLSAVFAELCRARAAERQVGVLLAQQRAKSQAAGAGEPVLREVEEQQREAERDQERRWRAVVALRVLCRLEFTPWLVGWLDARLPDLGAFAEWLLAVVDGARTSPDELLAMLGALQRGRFFADQLHVAQHLLLAVGASCGALLRPSSAAAASSGAPDWDPTASRLVAIAAALQRQSESKQQSALAITVARVGVSGYLLQHARSDSLLPALSLPADSKADSASPAALAARSRAMVQWLAVAYPSRGVSPLHTDTARRQHAKLLTDLAQSNIRGVVVGLVLLGHFALLETALELFLPAHPLSAFVRFLRGFWQREYKQAADAFSAGVETTTLALALKYAQLFAPSSLDVDTDLREFASYQGVFERQCRVLTVTIS